MFSGVVNLNTDLDTLSDEVDTLEAAIANIPQGPQGPSGPPGTDGGVARFGVCSSYPELPMLYSYVSGKDMPCLFTRFKSDFNPLISTHIAALYLSNELLSTYGTNAFTYAATDAGAGYVNVALFREDSGPVLLGAVGITGATPGTYSILSDADSDIVIGYVVTDTDGVTSSDLGAGAISYVASAGALTPDWSVEGSFLFTGNTTPDLSKTGSVWEFELLHNCIFPSTSVSGFSYQVKLGGQVLADYTDLAFTRTASSAYTGMLRTKISVQAVGDFFDSGFSAYRFLINVEPKQVNSAGLLLALPQQEKPGLIGIPFLNLGQTGFFEINLAGATEFSLVSATATKLQTNSNVV